MSNEDFLFYKTFWLIPNSSRLGITLAVSRQLFTAGQCKIPLGILTSTGYADDGATYHYMLIVVFNLAIGFITCTEK